MAWASEDSDNNPPVERRHLSAEMSSTIARSAIGLLFTFFSEPSWRRLPGASSRGHVARARKVGARSVQTSI